MRGQEMPRRDDVVVDEDDRVAGRAGESGVACFAAIRLGDERVLGAVALRDLRRGVGRSVVDDDDLEARRLLLRAQ